MIGLILLYFIGKSYYTLAERHSKHKWGHVILGIVSYYVGSFIGGILIGALFYALNDQESLESMGDIILGIMVMPFGLLICYALYFILKRNWEDDMAEI